MTKRDVFRRNLKLFFGDFHLAGAYAFPHYNNSVSPSRRESLLAELHSADKRVLKQCEFDLIVPRGTY